MLFLLVVCFHGTVILETGECLAFASYPTRQECRDVVADILRANRRPEGYFMACVRAPGVGK